MAFFSCNLNTSCRIPAAAGAPFVMNDDSTYCFHLPSINGVMPASTNAFLMASWQCVFSCCQCNSPL